LDAPNKNHKDVYYTRKKRFALHLQAITDHKGLFTHYLVGWPGSVHDSKVLQFSEIWTNRFKLFHDQEFLLADTGYPISTWIIPPFKDTDDQQQRRFNVKHSKCRVVVENAFGRLKGRFQLLREMRAQDLKRANYLIACAVVLHNYIESQGEIWDDPYYEDDSDSDGEVEDELTEWGSEIERALGCRRRQQLMNIVLGLQE
jgi:hypothetical protein